MFGVYPLRTFTTGRCTESKIFVSREMGWISVKDFTVSNAFFLRRKNVAIIGGSLLLALPLLGKLSDNQSITALGLEIYFIDTTNIYGVCHWRCALLAIVYLRVLIG